MHPLTIILLIYAAFSAFLELVDTVNDHGNLSFFIIFTTFLAIAASGMMNKSRAGTLGVVAFFGLQTLALSLPGWAYSFVYGPSFYLSGTLGTIGLSVNIFALVAFVIAMAIYMRK